VVGDTTLVTWTSGIVFGLDLATGAERWRRKFDAGIQATPVDCEIGGFHRAIMLTGRTLVTLDPATGHVIHSVLLAAASGTQVAAGFGQAVAILVDGRVVAVDLVKGELLWAADAKLDPAGPAAVSRVGLVLAASREGTLFALSRKDGAIVYAEKTDLGALDGGVTLDGGKVLLGSSRGRLAAFDLSNGKLLWGPKSVDAPPAGPARRLGQALYVVLRSGQLLSLGADGSPRTTLALPGAPIAAPVVCGERLIVTTSSSVLAVEPSEDE
jgi:outer membrane protein assembly factor BamB